VLFAMAIFISLFRNNASRLLQFAMPLAQQVSRLDDVGSDTLSRLTSRITPFLFLLYIVAYIDRINVSFAAPQMHQQLGFSDGVYGLGAGIFFAGYLLFQLPSTLVLERVGARRGIAALLIAWGVVSAATSLVHTPVQFYVARFLLGSTEAGFFPGVILYSKRWFPDAAQARAVAWFMTAGPVAGLIGGPISGVLLNVHPHNFTGWQWLFLVEGAPAVILGAVVLLYLTEAPEDALWLSAPQRQWLLATLERDRPRSTNAVSFSRASLLTDRSLWNLAALYFGLNVCSYGITLWLPMAISDVGRLTNVTIGLISSIPYGTAVVAMVWLGRHSDRSGERRWHIALPGVLGGICLIAVAGSRSPVVLIAAMCLAFIAASSRVGAFWALSNRLFVGKAAALAVPIINAVGNAGGFFGPYVLGVTRNSANTNFGRGLLAIGIILVVSSSLALLVRTDR